MELYPLTYAVMCMAGLENNPVFLDELDEYDEETDLSYLSPYRYQLICHAYPLFSAIAEELAKSIVTDEENCRIGLAGYWTGNPFNLYRSYELWFPKDAYFAWWNEKPRGMPLPKWFSDFVHEHPQSESNSSRADVETIKAQNQAPADQVVFDGVTVADVRKMCEHSAPLKSILIAVSKWHKIPNGNQQRRDDVALESCLNMQAKDDGWGTGQKGGVAKEDLRVLVRYVTDNVKGRGQK